MRIFIDTNIIVSAVLTTDSTPWKAYDLAISLPNQGIISYQILDELINTFHRKLPNHMHKLHHFLATSFLSLELVSVPKHVEDNEGYIRDVKDRPILRAAVKAKADIILTGDKDLLESGITSPRIMTAREFLNLNDCEN
ncbi:MAG: putative toxin-antitoxin system toxin component, PIN family [Agathobacter sp.]|nr:putative toxin-antitoxin system toxin component, PIN family [Agathobacter sp.]